MKLRDFLAFVVFILPLVSSSQDGSSCSTPIPIPMDGVSRSYTISTGTGGNLICTSTGTTPVTFFSITSNSTAENMMLKVTGAANQPIEVGFYDGLSCTNGNFESGSSICFYDGKGIWAPSQNFVITANKTYIIRIKTSSTGTIQIAGQHNTPANNSCLTATPLGSELLFDNNATHKPATEISPSGICAPELDNTAFYVYTVENTGNSGISIESMDVDNNYGSNLLNLGFQVGLFTGTCSSLTSVSCYVGVFSDAQLYTGVLPAGTKVWVALDGILATNCDYSLRAINAVLLTATLKYFTVFKDTRENILKWVSLKEQDNAYFEIERSVDGISYVSIGRVAGQLNSSSEKEYEFADASPPVKCFYRLKMVSTNGKYSYSNIVRVDRGSAIKSKITFNNIVSDNLVLQISDLPQQKISIRIIDQSGRELCNQNAKINSGTNLISINTAHVSNGAYHLVLTSETFRESFTFLKH